MGRAAPKTPARLVGRYALYDEIGAGGMASVRLGRMRAPAGFAPVVAVKAIRSIYARDPELGAMFLDEARLAGHVRHPNVAPVIDVVKEGDELFIVMEYVHGETLARLLRAGEPMPAAIACAVICGLLDGLHAAHQATGAGGEPLGIVHRDVSPQNVMVGVDGVARVLDFGVAKARGRLQATTKDGEIKGKLAYMPPEQLRAGVVNHQADIYSAAVVLWEALTARRLFEGEDDDMVMDRILFGEVPPPSQFVPGVSRALDALVVRALSRMPQDRYSTAREMSVALKRSVAVASAAEVGEWVEGRAHDGLEARARLVRGITDAGGAPTTARPARRRRAGTWVAAVAALASAGAATLLLHGRKPLADSPPAGTSFAVEARFPTASESAPLFEPNPADPPPPAPRPLHLLPRGVRADCNPPFTRDGEGRKIFKVRCL